MGGPAARRYDPRRERGWVAQRRGGTIRALTTVDQQLSSSVPEGMHLKRYVSTARRQNGVDREMLETMVQAVGALRGSLVLCGWSDYAKHLINIFGAHGAVLCVADDVPFRAGWSFRGVPVLPLDQAVTQRPDHFVCSRIEDRVQFLGAVTGHREYLDQPMHLFPAANTAEGQFYEPWKQSAFYRGLRRERIRGEHPGSMLSADKLQLLLELAKQTLHLDGGVLEVGAWQGGSGWPLAELIRSRGVSKRLLLLDFFEQLPRTNSEGVMCEDEIRYWFSAYERAEIHAGNVDEAPELMDSGDWCFVHYDAGFAAERLERCFGSLLAGGIMVLDNYGHISGNPARYDRWFEARGHVVSSPPRSEQGWVLKHGDRA
jgi:hypothetical protein